MNTACDLSRREDYLRHALKELEAANTPKAKQRILTARRQALRGLSEVVDLSTQLTSFKRR